MPISLQNDSDAFESLARDVATMYMNRSGNNFVQYKGNDFINTVGFAMHLRPDESKIKEGNPSDAVFFSQEVIDGIQHVIDAIIDYGGIEPYMIIYPVVLKIEKPEKLFDSILSLPLFRVRHKYQEKESKYVDTSGRTYADSDDFTHNAQFPKCEMYYPTQLVFAHDNNQQASITYTTISPSIMKYVNITVSVLCLGAGALAMFTGIGIPFAVAITVSCAAYGVGTSAQTLVDRATHGETINPFADWDAFNAWAGIAANVIGFGLAGNAIRLSANVSEMAVEGLRIAESTQLALRASIYIPEVINLGVMAIQFYQLVKFWKQIPVEQKIIIGLQFLFFAASSYKMGIISVQNIEERVTQISYSELRNELTRQVDGVGSRLLGGYLDAATNRVGGISIRAINFFKKLVKYNTGDLIRTSIDESSAKYVTLAQEADEIGFRVCDEYFVCPEAAMDINDGVINEQNQPGTSSEVRLPEVIAKELAQTKKFVADDNIKIAQEWLKNTLGVDELENYQVNGVEIFKNMKFHEQIRARVFADIGRGLNRGLIRACIRFAEEGNAKTVGQFASDYEMASLQIHKNANDLALEFETLTPKQIKDDHKIELQTSIESRITYAELKDQKVNTLFADERPPAATKKARNIAISNIGTNNATEVYNNWRAQSERTLMQKMVGNGNADKNTLANAIINEAQISYPNADNQAINAAKLLRQYKNVDVDNFASTVGTDANNTIQSCRGNVESRVFEVTRKKETLPIRRLIFWNLEDQEYAKSTVVTVNTQTNEVNIQNFSLNKIKTETALSHNFKNVIMDHWDNNFNYTKFKGDLTTFINAIKQECEEYVGHSVVRAGLDYDSTVADIQSLKSIRFASIEQAICHVLKHAEDLDTANPAASVKKYFDDAQAIIQYTKDHPENVSSSWTQSGSARDFLFFKKSDKGGCDKVVVLVREGGEVILKTSFYDETIKEVPAQQKHAYRQPVNIKHASLLTFYFQLMLLAPRYGVLLPKDYELYNTEMDAKKAHTIIIMAGHYFEDGDVPNTLDLSKALNAAFPINNVSWNVVAMKVSKYFSFHIFEQKNDYLYCRIKDFCFIIFAPEISPDKTVVIKGNKQKYKDYTKTGTVSQNIGFDDSEVLDLANRICSYTDKATEITKGLREVFGGCWTCLRLSDYYYKLNDFNVFLKLTFNGGDITCVIFRC